jgi:hypothetical protein
MGWRIIRIAAAVLAGVIAALFLLIAITDPLLLSKQAKVSREYLREFREAERYTTAELKRTGNLPADLESWADRRNYVMSAFEATTDSRMCEGGFGMGPNDRYLLRFWRGDWEECYASPSGRSTLLLTTGALLRSGLWKDLALYWLIAFGASIFAWQVWPRTVRPAC